MGYDERAAAICADDSEMIDEIDAQLVNLGVEDLSTEEVMEIFSGDQNKARWIVPPTSSSVDWKSYQTTIVSNGTSYATQTLLAQPKSGNSNLSFGGDKAISSTYQWKAGTMDAAKVVASASVASLTGASWVTTVYDAIKSFVSGVSKETVIKGANVIYSYQTAETVSMIYVKKQSESGDQNLRLSHVSSTCTTEVGYQFRSLSFSDGTAIPQIQQGRKTITSTPSGYNSASKAVATVYPLTPEGPAHIM